jgi:FAD:protein FMN transferase
MSKSFSRFWELAATVPLTTAALGFPAHAATLHAADLHQGGVWKFHHEHVLGTSLEITVRAPHLAAARHAEAAALASLDHDEALLSTWRPDSEVSRWAQTRMVPVKVSPELFAVLAQFDHWRERTGGALDASVEAATRLWNMATAAGRVPTQQEIAMTVEAMQQPHWSLDKAHRTATRLSGVPLAFASFTKSYISGRAANAARAEGATGVMLNVGGDVIVRGDLTQTIAVANPTAYAENDPALGLVTLRDRAVATSGSYRRGFELAHALVTRPPRFSHIPPRFSHIFDPRTALPAAGVLSSTVIAPDPVTAGALATALSILPIEEGRRLASSFPDVEYLLVLQDGEQIASANWRRFSELRPAAFVASPAIAVNGLWNPAFELNISIQLPRMQDARARRPYVALWIEDADHYPIRTLALWFSKARWLNELKQWYRDDQVRTLSEGSDISRTISSATRLPGQYTLKWDGKDNEGKPVKAGKYTVCIEAAREHGGYTLQRHEFDFNGTPQQASLPAKDELGATTLDYRKR